jgi:ABC-type transporter Mla subunit MlaD
MDSKRAAFKVGLFVIVGIVSMLALIYFLSDSFLNPGVPYEAYFTESVQGLDVGTAVRFRGVSIGRITDVGLVTAEYPPPSDVSGEDLKLYRQVVVRFTINPRRIGRTGMIETAIERGLRVQIAAQGITGLSYLELTFVNPKQFPAQSVPWTPSSTVVPSIPSTFTQIQDAATRVVGELGNVDLPGMVTSITKLTNTLQDELTRGDAHQTLANASTLLDNLNGTVTQSDLPATSAAIRNLAGGSQTQQILSQLNQTTAQLAKISAELPALMASSQATINQANETTADLQAQLLPILQDIKNTTANLSTLSATLARNPSQMILGSPPPPPDDNGGR